VRRRGAFQIEDADRSAAGHDRLMELAHSRAAAGPGSIPRTDTAAIAMTALPRSNRPGNHSGIGVVAATVTAAARRTSKTRRASRPLHLSSEKDQPIG
jgi:hypothetical protein